ncbi:hypothetical protein FB446DRAFT_731925 [Lentinula raphanica]|nr:hypothetical protein FB446DRAFT_731925 [Lentinula raphanica]
MAMELDLISDMIEVRDTNVCRMFFIDWGSIGIVDEKKYVAIVGFTIMLWDHVDTFTTEVKYIWPRVGERKPIVYLFLINRYIMPLGFIINLVAYFKIDAEVSCMSFVPTKIRLMTPPLTWKTCRHFVRYEGAMTMIGINVVGLMMLIRIFALYKDQKWVVTGVASLLIAEIGVYSWLMSTGEPVQHHPNITSCTMIFGESNPAASSASAWIPLLYDTVIFSLTLHATIPSVRNAQGSAAIYIMKQLLKDGLIYYSVICAVNLALTAMIVAAQPGLKNVLAQLELLLSASLYL